jgi:hypothetical protein
MRPEWALLDEFEATCDKGRDSILTKGSWQWAGWSPAESREAVGGRKVRAPQDRVVGNADRP